ncbi:MAG TPA: glycosyltransferase family 4 protein, partial [Hyphomicrobiaceae bacterium]|nr:glycosyltransferase family 4 protein [Hyphomicrobiaceae bacterium]
MTNVFPPLIGGPATFADRLAHVLTGRGHKVSVVCSSQSAKDPGDAARPFRVVRVSLANRYAYEAKVRAVLVREMLAHRRILVAGLESYVLDAARVAPRRYILRVPGDTVWESARNYGETTLGFDEFQDAASPPAVVAGIIARRRQYLSRAVTVVTPSHYLEGVVRRWPGCPADLRTIINGVSLSDYPDREPSPRNGRALKALFVGRLTNWKGVETLLLASVGLSGVEITIVGDGPELPLLKALNAQLGGAGGGRSVRFLGRQSPDAVKASMLEHDVLVLPSNYEGMSHTLLEGCAAGLVPIVSAIGGNLEVITDGQHGLAVPYGDPDALRRALAALAADDVLRQRLALAARHRAGDFPFAATVDGYANL